MKYEFTAKEESMLRDAILEVGVPGHLKGYLYLRSAILIAMHNAEAVTSVTKCIYPDVAKIYRTTDAKVERAIRNAIEIAWNRNSEGIKKLYGEGDMKRRPTNSNFIAELAEAVKKAAKA